MKPANSFDDLYKQISLRKGPFLLVFFVIVTLSYGVLFAIDFTPEDKVTEDAESAQGFTSRVENVVNLINGGLLPKAAEPSTDPGLEVVIPEGAEGETETDAPIEPEEETEGQSEEGENEPLPVDDQPIRETSRDALPVSITFESLGNRTVPVRNPASRTIAALDNALLSGAVRHPDSADLKNTGNIFILGHSSYLPNVLNKNFQAFNGLQNMTWGDVIRVRSADTEYVYQVDRVYKAKASEVSVPVNTGKAKLTLATCNSFASKDDRFIVEASLVSTRAL